MHFLELFKIASAKAADAAGVDQAFGVPDLLNGRIHDVSSIIHIFLNVLYIAGVGLGLFDIIFGGLYYLTAGGNDDRANKGKNAIIQGVVGLVALFLAVEAISFLFKQFFS